MKKYLVPIVITITIFIAIVAGSLWKDEGRPVDYFSLDQTSGTIAVNNITENVNGTYVNKAGTLTLTEPGIRGTAMNITNVSGSYLNISYNRDQFEVGNWSISLWINRETTLVPGSTAGIISNVPSGTGTLRASVDANSATLIFRTWNETNGTFSITLAEPQLDTWEHYIFMMNGTSIAMFKNGTLVNATDFTGGISSSTHQPLTVGGRETDAIRGIGGRVDEVGIWNRTLTSEEILDLYNGGLGIFFGQELVESITVELNEPDDNIISSSSSLLFNGTFSPVNLTLINSTLFIYNSSGDIDTTTTVAVTGAEDNSTSINHTFSIPEDFTWNYQACGTNETNPSNVVCSSATANRSLTVGGIEIVTIFPDVFETAFETIEQNITSEFAISSVQLLWNGSTRSSTITTAGDAHFLRSSFDIPIVNGTVDFNWNVTYTGGFVQNFSISNQDVAAINLSLLEAAQTVPYINFTFKNETTLEEDTTAFIPRSSFVYFLGTGAVNKTLSFTSATEFNNYTLAFSPPDKTINVTLDLDYDNSESQQRTFSPSTLFSLSNSTTDQVLFLLPTNDGIFVTFQVINTALQPIEEANVRLEKSGILTSETQTGASGTTNVFLNPNTPYFLNVSKEGFQEFTTTQTFPTTEFTISLGLAAAPDINDYLRGISLNIFPPVQILENNTDYIFNFTIGSTFWTLEEYGFTLTNTTDIIGRITGSIGTGGNVSLTNNTGDNRLIRMDYFWKIDGNYSNASIAWGVDEFTEGSILGFVNRFKAYLGAGIFGANGFTTAIIVFFIIFLPTALLSFKFGLRSPEAIMLIATFIIGAMDMGLNLISFAYDTPVGGVSVIRGVPTFLAGLITIAVYLGRNR